MVTRFDDQVVVVTGASGSLGKVYALEIARRGGAVVANDLGSDLHGHGASSEALDQLVSDIRDVGGSAVASYDSVATEAGGDAIFRTAIDNFGRIDALINNAGNIRIAPFEETTADDVSSLLAVHIAGACNVTRPIYRHMKQRGYGRILFTSSGSAFGNPNQAAYAAAKAGMIGLMNSLSLEGEPHGVLCNAILPASATRMIGALRPENLASVAISTTEFRDSLQPENVAPLALYLISRECASTHRAFSAVGNRFAEVFLAAKIGWLAPRNTVPTVEDIAANFDRICDSDGFAIPASMVDEYRIIGEAVTASTVDPVAN